MYGTNRTIWIPLIVMLSLAVLAGTVQAQGGRITDPRDARGHERRSFEPIGYRPAAGQHQRVDSQLYVTGQVSGLGAFRGEVPYEAGDTFRGDTGGAATSSFRRQSVGRSDVLGGRVHGSAPFRDPDTAVTTAGRVLDRDTVRRPLDTDDHMPVRSLAEDLFIDATAGYRRIAPVGRDAQRDQLIGPVREEFRQEPFRDRARPLTVPVDSGELFGLVGEQERADLVRQLRETAREPTDEQASARLDARVDRLPETIASERFIRPLDRPDEAEPAERTGARMLPPPGEDVYLDLLVTMRDRQTDEADESFFGPPRDAETLHRPDREAETPLVETRPGRPVIVRGLAGQGRDQFNRRMRDAERNLSQGRFYDARQGFEMARVIDGRNPMSSIGLAMAAFGAGEPATAGFNLHRAMRLFPPIMETQFNLPDMMPQERIEEMLPEVHRRLEARARDTQMLLLATFLHHNLRQRQEAEEFARRLRDASEDDPIGAAYAEYVLTGRLPSEVEQTQQPAGQ